jgi:hypothetical protein
VPTTTLTPKQARFVNEYLRNGLNGAAAYRAAGYKVTGPSVARTEATRLLAKPSIASAVALQQQQIATQAGYSTAAWLRDSLEDWRLARSAGNYAACASIGRNVGQHLGALRETAGDRVTEQLVDTLRDAVSQLGEGNKARGLPEARDTVEVEARLVD